MNEEVDTGREDFEEEVTRHIETPSLDVEAVRKLESKRREALERGDVAASIRYAAQILSGGATAPAPARPAPEPLSKEQALRKASEALEAGDVLEAIAYRVQAQKAVDA